jgi:uncharacterized protein YchJ
MNDQTTSQSENKEKHWQRSPACLDARVGPEYEYEPMESTPPWFRYAPPNIMGETKAEKEEQEEAQKEQIKLGILKTKATMHAPTLSPTSQHAKMTPILQDFVNSMKENPEQTAMKQAQSLTNFRPKVRDPKTGKKRKLSPNDKCPCGSGKKYKVCHGRGV